MPIDNVNFKSENPKQKILSKFKFLNNYQHKIRTLVMGDLKKLRSIFDLWHIKNIDSTKLKKITNRFIEHFDGIDAYMYILLNIVTEKIFISTSTLISTRTILQYVLLTKICIRNICIYNVRAQCKSSSDIESHKQI